MFRLLLVLLMVISCDLMVSESAMSQMSPEGLKAMREGMARAQKKAAEKEAKKEKRSDSTPSPKARRGRPAARVKSKDKDEMKKDASAVPSFKLFDVKPESLMAVLDSDGDGQLSGKEIDYATDQLLRLDANDNGQIEADELPGVSATMTEPAISGFDPDYEGPGQQVYKTIAGFDADENGVLTRSEMRAEYKAAFRSIDSDGDRKIDPKELMEFSSKQ